MNDAPPTPDKARVIALGLYEAMRQSCRMYGAEMDAVLECLIDLHLQTMPKPNALSDSIKRALSKPN